MGANTVRYRPLLTHAARPSTFDVAAVDENGVARDVAVAGEHPLTLYVDKRELLTLMTLGAAPEALAIGYLRNQRLVERLDDIVAVQVDWETNSVVVKTRYWTRRSRREDGQADDDASGCGQGTVFGDLMEDIDNVRHWRRTLTQAALYALLDKVACTRRSYKQAAPCTAARSPRTATAADIRMFVEDVGRHNAVDAIAARCGWTATVRTRSLYTTAPHVGDGDQGGRWAFRSWCHAPG
jgi:FdhD protein